MAAEEATPRRRVVEWVLGRETTYRTGTKDFSKLLENHQALTRRLREEMLFDQLATNVIEWHEAMLRFAARLSSGVGLSSRETWARTEQECSLMLRVANVLSAAFSFSEAVERNGRHRKHGCGDSICTIARALRNRLQHDVLGHSHWYVPIIVSRDSPQARAMPSNDRKDLVEFRIRWKDISDSIRSAGPRRRFESACRQEFPDTKAIDTIIVVNGHLRCLSKVMAAKRVKQPLDALTATHRKLSEQAGSWDRTAVSPAGKTLGLKHARAIVVQIEELMNRNQTLPDLELVQLGGGRAAPGDMEQLKKRLDLLLKTCDNKDLRHAIEQLDLNSPTSPLGSTGEVGLAEEIERQFRRMLDAEGELFDSARLLRQIEYGLATAEDRPVDE